jgi:hypothetical protein
MTPEDQALANLLEEAVGGAYEALLRFSREIATLLQDANREHPIAATLKSTDSQ